MSPSEPACELTVVLPVFNEAGSLPQVIPELTAALECYAPHYEIIAVDDGSRILRVL